MSSLNPQPSIADMASIDRQSLVISMQRPTAPRAKAMWIPGERIADYRRLFAFYLDIVENTDFALQRDARAHDRMMRDGTIFSTIRVRQLATASRGISFSPAEDSPEAKVFCDLTREMFESIERLPETLLNILDAIPRGMSFQEITWELDDKLVFRPRRLNPVHPSRVKFDLMNNPVLISPIDIFWGERLPPNTFLHHVYDPEPGDWNYPEEEARLMFGHSLLDRLYPWFLWKQILIRNNLRFTDRMASGTLLGKFPYRGNVAREELRDMLASIQSHSVALFPSDAGYEVEPLKMTEGGAGTLFKDAISYMDDQLARMILGSTFLADDSSSGSYARSEVLERTSFGRVVAFDAETMVSTLRDQLVTAIFNMNHWPLKLRPRVKFKSGPRWSLTEVVNACVKLSEMGYPIALNVVEEETQIRQPSPGETIIQLRPYSMEASITTGEGGPDAAILIDAPEGTPEQKAFQQRGRVRMGLMPVPSREAVAEHVGGSEAETISYAGGARKLVQFDYQREDDSVWAYFVEPYSFRRSSVGDVLLYGYDVHEGAIKSFRLDRMSSVHPLDISFEPRWSVELTQEKHNDKRFKGQARQEGNGARRAGHRSPTAVGAS